MTQEATIPLMVNGALPANPFADITIHHYKPHPDYPCECWCLAPRHTARHWHRFEPTLADNRVCMCGGPADTEPHQQPPEKDIR